MVMIIIHVAYITCLVTSTAWHVYDVIGVYKLHHRAGRVLYFAERAILRLAGTVMVEIEARNINKASNTVVASTVMGEGRAHNRGACHPAKRPRH